MKEYGVQISSETCTFLHDIKLFLSPYDELSASLTNKQHHVWDSTPL